MKQIKKVLSILVVFSLMLGTAACGSKNEPTPSPTPKATNTPTEAPTATPEPEPEPELPEVLTRYEAQDMGGRVIRYATDWDVVAVSSMAQPDASATLDAQLRYENLKRIEEKYNITIERIDIPNTDIPEQVTLGQMAGAPFADMVSLQGYQAMPLILNDQLLEVESYAPAQANIYGDQLAVMMTDAVMGKHYFFKSTGAGTGAEILGYNKDILNSIGAEDPQELYEKGQWTWDKFLEMCKLATKDTDGDGVTDQWGYSGIGMLLAMWLIPSNGGVMWDVNSRTEMITDPKMVKALEFFNQLYNVDKVVSTYNNDFWAWGENQDMWQEGHSAFFRVQAWLIDGAGGPDVIPFEYHVVPFPVGPDNKDGKVRAEGPPGGFTIPAGVDNPTFVYQIYEESAEFWRVGEQDFEEFVMAGARNYPEGFMLTEKDIDYLIYNTGELGRPDYRDLLTDVNWGEIWTNIWDQSQTVAQALEAMKQTVQDRIDLFFEVMDEQ